MGGGGGGDGCQKEIEGKGGGGGGNFHKLTRNSPAFFTKYEHLLYAKRGPK